MRSRIKKIDECVRLFMIEIPEEMVKRAVEEVYKEIKKVVKIPGFRPGNAPQDLLEKHYSGDAREEALKRLIPEGYRKALDTHKVVPTGFPRISKINFEFNKPFTFEAEVDTRPNIKLKNYKGVKITKKRLSVSKEELDESLSRLQNVYAIYRGK